MEEIPNKENYCFRTKHNYQTNSQVTYKETCIIEDVKYDDGELFHEKYNCKIIFKLNLKEKIDNYDIKFSSKNGLTTIFYTISSDLVSKRYYFFPLKISVPTQNINIKYVQ